mmetsp:Transcript_18937/g.36581  ORF Transcript_18937/g.36581 Transcript_18937/m.36581 type:complete len:333 (+) Transcript_18937:164-1162(+)
MEAKRTLPVTLLAAAKRGYISVLKRQLEDDSEVSVNDVDEFNNTLLHVASKAGNRDAVMYLLSLPDIQKDAMNGEFKTPAEVASEAGNLELSKEISLAIENGPVHEVRPNKHNMQPVEAADPATDDNAENQVKPSSATKVPDPSGTSEDQDDLFDAGLKSTELDFSEDELNEHGPITEEQKQRYTNYAEILDNMRMVNRDLKDKLKATNLQLHEKTKLLRSKEATVNELSNELVIAKSAADGAMQNREDMHKIIDKLTKELHAATLYSRKLETHKKEAEERLASLIGTKEALELADKKQQEEINALKDKIIERMANQHELEMKLKTMKASSS